MLSAFINANIVIQNDIYSFKYESLTNGIGKTLKGKPLVFEVGFWEWQRKMAILGMVWLVLAGI